MHIRGPCRYLGTGDRVPPLPPLSGTESVPRKGDSSLSREAACTYYPITCQLTHSYYFRYYVTSRSLQLMPATHGLSFSLDCSRLCHQPQDLPILFLSFPTAGSSLSAWSPFLFVLPLLAPSLFFSSGPSLSFHSPLPFVLALLAPSLSLSVSPHRWSLPACVYPFPYRLCPSIGPRPSQLSSRIRV
jgi:hypothetical protein